MIKLNVLLAKTDHLAGVFKKGLEEYVRFFKGHQGAFKGERKTYVPKAGTIDQPGQRSHKRVVTTVGEKLDYFVNSSKEYINVLFTQERTNASGVAKAKLEVDGVDFGVLTSLELLRLKTLLEMGAFKEMHENIPVRSEDEIWNPSSDPELSDRGIFETDIQSGVVKTTVKESYILHDPNIGSVEGSKYTPQVAVKDTILDLGDYTYQKFSGEFSHVQRATILQRRSKLLTAVIAALKEANDVEIVESPLTADKIFDYLYG